MSKEIKQNANEDEIIAIHQAFMENTGYYIESIILEWKT